MIKTGRSIWGIRLKSFDEALKYLRIKHSQKKIMLLQIKKELHNEIISIQTRIDSGFIPESKPPGIQKSLAAWEESWFESQHCFTIRFKYGLFGLSPTKVNQYLTELLGKQRDELQELRKELVTMLEKRKQLLNKLSFWENTNHSEEAAVALETSMEEVAAALQPSIEEAHVPELQQEAASSEEEDNEVEVKEQLEEQLREKLETQIKEQLLVDLKNQLLTKKPGDTKDYWREIKELIKQKITEEQKQFKSRSNVIAFQQKGRRQCIPHATPVPYKQRLTINGSGFWGEDIEPLLFYPHMKYEDELVPEAMIENDSNHRERHIESKQSPAITNQAYLLKKKYIVGKLAGADLKDSSGKMIIATNEVITEQVMKQAEQQGKLAELIVNMVIPELKE